MTDPAHLMSAVRGGTPHRQRSLGRAAAMLGFALSGFFDGILLHQILQWHHLLSSVDAVKDLRTQVLADGLFHLLMYVIAVVALVRLWQHRAGLGDAGAGRRLWCRALIGFGAWHVVDALLSHGLLGIHRIKPDASSPLAWDLGWLFVFGLLPLIAGWRVIRRDPPGHGGSGGTATLATLAAAALIAGAWAAWPPPAQPGRLMVLFAPGIDGPRAFAALAALDARVLWVDRSGGLWAVRIDDPQRARQLYRHGALLVGHSAIPAGCLGWTTAVGR